MAEQTENTGSFPHRIGTTDRDRLKSFLRVAEQYAHKSPEDQEHERRFMARDLATYNAQTES